MLQNWGGRLGEKYSGKNQTELAWVRYSLYIFFIQNFVDWLEDLLESITVLLIINGQKAGEEIKRDGPASASPWKGGPEPKAKTCVRESEMSCAGNNAVSVSSLHVPPFFILSFLLPLSISLWLLCFFYLEENESPNSFTQPLPSFTMKKKRYQWSKKVCVCITQGIGTSIHTYIHIHVWLCLKVVGMYCAKN